MKTLMIASVMAAGAALAATVENAAPADELARAKQKAVAEAPLAPPGYRRPADWKPVLYRKGLREIANDHSKEVMARAAKQMKKVDAVNAAGKWKATGASIDAHKCPEWFVDAKLGTPPSTRTSAPSGSSTRSSASSSTGARGPSPRGALT